MKTLSTQKNPKIDVLAETASKISPRGARRHLRCRTDQSFSSVLAHFTIRPPQIRPHIWSPKPGRALPLCGARSNILPGGSRVELSSVQSLVQIRSDQIEVSPYSNSRTAALLARLHTATTQSRTSLSDSKITPNFYSF